MLYSRNDVVLLPIPFTDLTSSKVRPAIVIGHGTHAGDLFVVPVRSQLPNADLTRVDWKAAKLNVPSGVKAQIATIEDRLIRKAVGHLSLADTTTLDRHLRSWLSL